MLALLSALLWLLLASAPGHAARLTGVRTFTAPGRARILLLLADDGEPGITELQTRSSPPVGAIAARATCYLADLRLDPELPVEQPTDTDGLRRVLVAQVGDGVQVTAELDGPRRIRAERIDARAVLIDLMPEATASGEQSGEQSGKQSGAGAGEGSATGALPQDADAAEAEAVAAALPSRAQLVAWAQGVDLVRAAGGRPKTRPVIVLDAGHGGWDHGAVGVTGTREADIALQLVRRTAAGIAAHLDADVILTRDRDEYLTLTQRARIANDAQADLFLSIHANAALGPQAWGIETYSMDTASDKGAARVAARENAIAWESGEGEEADRLAAQLVTAGTMRLSKELAAHVQAGVCRRLGTTYGADNVHDLGTKTALFSVLTRTRMPAVLFESSFVSNPTDERRLRAPHWQQAVADALVDAIGAWMQRQGGGATGGEAVRTPRPDAAGVAP